MPTDTSTNAGTGPSTGAPSDPSGPAGPSGNGIRERTPGPSTKPALIVVGIAALVLLTGIIGAALTSSGSAQAPAVHRLPTAKGATITATPGRHTLAPITTGGQPPSDILDAVALPKGTTVTTGTATNNGIGLYDHSLSFTVPVSDQRVIDFFRAELKALKWQIVSQGSPPHGTAGYRIVGQHPSSDGYEWEIGVTVAPTTFGSGAGQAVDSTPYTVRLFAVTDN
jgi:hypothetical protein